MVVYIDELGGTTPSSRPKPDSGQHPGTHSHPEPEHATTTPVLNMSRLGRIPV